MAATSTVIDATPYVLAFNNNEICLRGPAKLVDEIRKVPGCTARQAANFSFYTLPYRRESFLLAEAWASPAAVSEGYKEARRNLLSPSPSQAKWIDDNLRLVGLDPTLFLDHQRACMFSGSCREFIFNASEQGTGKTRVALGLCQLWGVRKLVVVCPKSLIGEWKKEATKIGSKFIFIDMKSNVGDRRLKIRQAMNDHGVVAIVINYDVIDDLLPELMALKPDALVLDESYRAKSPKAKSTKALIKLSRVCKKRICQTGTPIGNDIGDLFTQCLILDPNFAYQTYSAFCERFVKYQPTFLKDVQLMKPTGCSDTAGLINLLSPFWFRVTKEECLNLPPKENIRVELAMPPELKNLYKEVRIRGEAALGNITSMADARVVHLRLQQLCGGIAPDLTNGILALVSNVDEDDSGPIYREMPCAKLEWVKQYAKDVLVGNPGSRAIIWVRFTAELHRIKKELDLILPAHRVATAYGATKENELEDLKASFNSRSYDGVQVIVAQIDKMHPGHNLQACDDNIYFNHTWSYLKRSQSEDRSHRYGREGTVRNIDLVYENSKDEDCMAAIDAKEDLAITFSLPTLKR
jgi:SNF2 family DNA or RNA helicase